MNHDQATALVRIAAVAHDRPIPDGAPDVWFVAFEDLDFNLGRRAVVELIKSSPYWPRPADVLERARLIAQQEQREIAKRRQLEAREQFAITSTTETPAAAKRTGANMVRHVLGRLKDAGQDTANGKFLGRERADVVAEAAVGEWLDRTDGGGPA